MCPTTPVFVLMMELVPDTRLHPPPNSKYCLSLFPRLFGVEHLLLPRRLSWRWWAILTSPYLPFDWRLFDIDEEQQNSNTFLIKKTRSIGDSHRDRVASFFHTYWGSNVTRGHRSCRLNWLRIGELKKKRNLWCCYRQRDNVDTPRDT